MARHFIAACVFCLLCADRVPCQQHYEPSFSSPNLLLDNFNAKVFRTTTNNNNNNDSILLLNDTIQHKIPPPPTNFNPTISTQYDPDDSRNPYTNQIPLQRRKKRHTGGSSSSNSNHHHHHIDDEDDQHYPETTRTFVKKIFQQFGRRGAMDLNEFERMLKKLKLYELIGEKAEIAATGAVATAATPTTDSSVVAATPVNHQSNNSDNIYTSNQIQNASQCISNKKLFANIFPEQKGPQPAAANNHLSNEFPLLNKNYLIDETANFEINTKNIYSLCPILLYQLIAPTEAERSGCIDPSFLDLQESILTTNLDDQLGEEKDVFLIWLFSFLSVFLCGLLGLVGVAIIPLMKTKYYKDIIQFLVALAVGTMTGDALLHLIPHSIMGQSEEEMVMKGLVCVLGIIFFYATEHSFTMISEWRKQNAKKSIPSAKVRVVREANSGSINNSKAAGELCKGKYSSYPYCYDEIAMDTKGDHHHHRQQHEQQQQPPKNYNNHETEQSLLATINENNKLTTATTNLNENITTVIGGIENGKEKDTLPVSVILREHDHVHRGHSHKHGHVHSPPETISAVAWMIILGDGLHNFTDGMAIGAAFSENIAGGLSTSLAVFCHELPHELGDFAILIQAGMSARSAVLYNLMTGLLSFVGMVVGIFFGTSDEASKWMFACAAGLFIYIALVDMMPEMTSAHNTIQQMFLQLIGLVGGLCSMLLIAIYEHDLMNVFGKNGIGHGLSGIGSGGNGHNH